jgi:hypothetical protein
MADGAAAGVTTTAAGLVARAGVGAGRGVRIGSDGAGGAHATPISTQTNVKLTAARTLQA